jgi:hypothetical protein
MTQAHLELTALRELTTAEGLNLSSQGSDIHPAFGRRALRICTRSTLLQRQSLGEGSRTNTTSLHRT